MHISLGKKHTIYKKPTIKTRFVKLEVNKKKRQVNLFSKQKNKDAY